jgi:hypothetical protein
MQKVIVAGMIETAKLRILDYDYINMRVLVEVFDFKDKGMIGYQFGVPILIGDLGKGNETLQIIRMRAERILSNRVMYQIDLPAEGTIF